MNGLTLRQGPSLGSVSKRCWKPALLLAVLVTCCTSSASAQGHGRRYFPYSHRSQPGTAAQWSRVRIGEAIQLQPVRFILPGAGGTVSIYQSAGNSQTNASPAQYEIGVGYTYRLRLSDMPEFPGKELYPSLELLDKLHPPAGKIDEFPIPVSFSKVEIEEALAGRLVTKVVYLEQPQLAPPSDMRTPTNTWTLPDKVNLIAEADRRGRPMAIVRIGSRKPAANGRDYGFFGNGGPVNPSGSATMLPLPPPVTATARAKTPNSRVQQAAGVSRITRPAPASSAAVTRRLK